ncbi:alpha-2A adrenergic receptor-like [Babylonia areolata]|uniref:alpha-2A adrenergic receptor-like n=1 Tax=Babylonia areolata TaxID=304850 RepID=UPI003FD54DD1
MSRPLTTRSTFRPPPFVSVSKETSPSLFTTPSLPTTDVVLFTTVGPGSGTGISDDAAWWNLTDVNLTTPSAVTSGGADHHFPAGYPSGYTWPHIIIASIIITVVILIIVVGNFLVMWAIVRDKNLKGTQNYFIGSLALADFLLGLLIVPFSLANELMGYWHFGTVFCEVWKAMDVLLCTASISSLCLISLDRYWSITKAIHYSRQRTPKRAAVMIFIVWFVSAAICIPPLIGWNQPTPDSEWPVCALSEDIGYVLYSSMGSFYIPAFIMVFVYFKIYQAAKARARKNVSKAPRGVQGEKSEQKSTESSGTEHPTQRHLDHSQFSLDMTLTPTMTLTNTNTLPLGNVCPENGQDGQLKTYWREGVDHNVFASANNVLCRLTGVKVGSSSQEEEEGGVAGSGCRCVNEMLEDGAGAAPTSEDEACRQLQDFRTRSLSLPCRAPRHDELTKLISTDSDSCDALGGPALNLLDRGRLALSMPTTTTTDTDSSMDLSHLQHRHLPPPHYQVPAGSVTSLKTLTPPLSDVSTPLNTPVNSPVTEAAACGQDNGTIQQFHVLEPKQNGQVEQSPCPQTPPPRQSKGGLLGSLRRQLFQTNNGRVGERHKAVPKKKEPRRTPREDKNDFFSAERQKRKLAKARERRATLVLGLVMAAFILCWLPFFLLYVVSAFCPGCIPMMVFTVFFWIGYCNSALNPIIYTVFNRDFRRAFQRILFGRKRGRR